jgi:CheY-like chemotaxis protein
MSVMADPNENPTRAEFAERVHDALSRLYDLAHIRSHPLAEMLAPEGANPLERSQELRRVLLDAIRAVRPAAGVPAHSPDWRGYRILELRYIEGLEPRTIMGELAIGRSQYFREQAHALGAVTDVLWACWRDARAEEDAGDEGASHADLLRTAVERVDERSSSEVIRGGQLLEELRPVIESLARAEGVSLTMDSSCGGFDLRVDRVLLRQAVLGLAAHGLSGARGGEAVLGCFADGGEGGIRLQVRPRPAAGIVAEGEEGADPWRELVAAMGGSVRVGGDGRDGWEARLVWPTGHPVLLVIDDNVDFLGLYRRYTAGHNWQIVGATSRAETYQAIAWARPALILLDVLMPGEDGWELLLALKGRDDTRDIAVIVCSVLDQPKLALTLGAAGYLRKPVQKQDLLRVLASYESAAATPERGSPVRLPRRG